MSLVVFRSKAAGEIFMFAETARRIFEIIGRSESARGVITAEQVTDALQRLVSAVEQEKAQRAFPLIEMLRAAEKKKVDVTWGV
jgi:hypothetical protein